MLNVKFKIDGSRETENGIKGKSKKAEEKRQKAEGQQQS